MTIRDMDSFIGAIWDWAILDGCFGHTRVRPTDIDGLVERNGQFLLLEGKSPGKSVPTGQEIIFRRLLKTGIFTIIVIWGIPDTPESLKLFYRTSVKTIEPATLADLRAAVHSWFSWAEAKVRK